VKNKQFIPTVLLKTSENKTIELTKIIYKQTLLTKLSLEFTITLSFDSIMRIFSELLRLGGTGGAASFVGEHSLGDDIGDGGGR